MKPQNTNLLQPTKFLLSFPEAPDMVYFCQKASLPGIALGMSEQVTPNLNIFHSGTKIEYDPFEVTFLVNENLTSWLNIYRWMVDLSSVDANYAKRKENRKQAVLTVMSNLNNPKIRVKLYNTFPTTLSELEFNTTLSAEDHLTASVSFRYDWFEIETL